MNSRFANFRNHRLFRILRAVIVGYALVIFIMWSLQRALLYHPRTDVPLDLDAHPKIAELYSHSSSLTITTQDGERLGAWLLTHSPPPAAGTSSSETTEKVQDNSQSSRRLILFFHGNGGDRANRLGWYQIFHRLGADVLAIDYRGYGDSSGSPSESGLAEDAQAAWQFATTELGYSASQIVVFGVSLGGGVAVRLTSALCETGVTPQGMVIVATFSSVTDVASGRYPFLPVRWILSDQFDSASRIASVTCPILQFHGDQDTVVPYQYGQKLFGQIHPPAASLPPTFVTLNGVGHNDLIRSAGSQIESELAAYFNRLAAEAVRERVPVP